MVDVRTIATTNNNNARTINRDLSPDSVILTLESNLSSLFSSASASVDRCSFASEGIDHDSLSSSEVSQHLGGHETLSGPDLNLPHSNKPILHNNNNNNNSLYCQKVEKKAKVGQEDANKVLLYDDNIFQGLDSARSSFSVALKECQERRSRSEALAKNPDRQRPASVDFNNNTALNVVSSSPRLAMMKKTSVCSRKSGNFPSPGTPNYRHANASVGVNKGWSSERVPLPSNGNNRKAIGAALLPLNNMKALPSKWEDAERWIFSPVSGETGGRPSSCHQQQQQQPLRRPKSKSGPLGAPGMAYYSMYSPAAQMYEGGNLSCHMVGSPFSAAVMMADGMSFRGGTACFDNSEPCIARSVSVHGCTDLMCQPSHTSSRGEKGEGVKDAATNVSRAVSRRDMATQMSPDGSCNSSPRRSFSPSTPSILPIMEVQSMSSPKSEVRDVQVDEKVTVTRWSKKYRGRLSSKGSDIVDEWKSNASEPCSSAWEVADTAKSISKVRRDEAKITAWENLQKAKAEASIRKLEMKLEKKRSSSMEKIMKKLRSAQKKAQDMRSAVLTNQAMQVSKPNSTALLSFRRTRHMGSLSGCFTCHAF